MMVVVSTLAGLLGGAWLTFCLVMACSSRARNSFCDWLDEREKEDG